MIMCVLDELCISLVFDDVNVAVCACVVIICIYIYIYIYVIGLRWFET